ncbi:patatin-like phospholipase family protein [Planomonospora venezuelensis]|uniref:NTE family protein n=1 Tax=Planomonospora venezuelensis TaxID=1999 RepID=A0A841CT44_PLAVE|nr:patatin-like phospholipase family protein [Planomonospora venezuelensis]MBB5961592.1 NTE family protein [Planomonospora venezuelensis]GIM98738.1 patatin [Planomonospora venezuelensis]
MTRALVLGGGGVAGIAWEAGIVTGLRRAGVELGTADLVVGTSAGSVVGALVTTGADLESAVAAQAGSETEARVPAVDMEAVMAAFGILFDPSLEPREARRRVGAMAMATKDTGARIETIGERLPVKEWPECRLLVTAVDAGTGEFVVWDRDSGAPLVSAVASSCAVPCVFPPVEIGGRRYMDGGVRSATNADLAKGSSAVVIVEPMAHLSPRSRFRSEVAELGDAAVAHVAPDEASVAVFGANVLDPALWRPAFDAGLAQALAVADAVGKTWS